MAVEAGGGGCGALPAEVILLLVGLEPQGGIHIIWGEKSERREVRQSGYFGVKRTRKKGPGNQEDARLALTLWELMSIGRQPAVGGREGAGVAGVLGALVLVQDHHPLHPGHI